MHALDASAAFIASGCVFSGLVDFWDAVEPTCQGRYAVLQVCLRKGYRPLLKLLTYLLETFLVYARTIAAVISKALLIPISEL